MSDDVAWLYREGLCCWCVRSGRTFRMVYGSMENGLSVTDKTVYTDWFVVFGGLPCVLSFLGHLYSKASYEFERYLTIVLS